MIYENIKAIADKMNIDYQRLTKQINHKVEKGTARENIIKEFLKDYLPEIYGIESGIIIDSNGKQSNQQDIFIFDKNSSPKFLNIEEVKIIPVESVKCIIEIKSCLTRDELIKSLKNIESVRSMEKVFMDKNFNTNYPFGCIFAYESELSLDKQIEIIENELQNIDIKNYPSFIISLDKGVLSLLDKNNLFITRILPSENTIFAKQESINIGDNLMIFYLLCITGIFLDNKNYNYPNLIEYAKKSGFINPSKELDNKRAFGRGLKFVLSGNKEINLDNSYKLQEYWKSLSKNDETLMEKALLFLQKMKELDIKFIDDIDNIIDFIKWVKDNIPPEHLK